MRSTPFALAVILLASPALACTGPTVSAGKFETGEKGWGEPDAQFRVEGSEAILTPEPGTQTARWDAGKPLTNMDTCVTITMPASDADASRGYAGLLFWVVDKDNFHQAVISRNGMVTIARKADGRILAIPPVNWLQTSAVQLGPNAKNTLRVSIDGQQVIMRVNETEVARFRGQAPDAPSHVGLVASSAPSAADTWRMSDFKVADIPAPAPANTNAPAASATNASPAAAGTATTPAANSPAPPAATDTTGAVSPAPTGDCGTGAVLYEDTFAAHDPMWGNKDAEVSIGGGQAEFDPQPGTPTLRWNRAFVFRDLDACASVQLANPTTDPTASYAGLVFWAQDSRNYHQAVVAPNGYFTVARVVDGKVVAKRPIAWTKNAAVKTGPKERNTLRVTAKGAEVQVFINGKQAGSFRGEPPLGPTYIGMLAASAASKKGDTWSISDLKVTAPQ